MVFTCTSPWRQSHNAKRFSSTTSFYTEAVVCISDKTICVDIEGTLFYEKSLFHLMYRMSFLKGQGNILWDTQLINRLSTAKVGKKKGGPQKNGHVS